MDESASRSLSRLGDILATLVDRRVGILHAVDEFPPQAGAPDFFHFYARAADTSAFCAQRNFANTGGASSRRELALAKAVGEAVERYCAAIYELEDYPLCSFRTACFPCVPPGEFALFSQAQYRRPDFRFVPFTEETPVRWAPAWDPGEREVRHVPAATVVIPYTFYLDSGDSPILQPISTGLACHCSFEEAAVSAICEVVERDAVAIFWQAGLSPPRIRAPSLDPANRDLVERFSRVGHEIALLEITTDVGIPTILATARHRDPAVPAFAVAGAADLSPRRAVRKSLEELAHTLRLCRTILADEPRLPEDPEHGNVADQRAHLNFWCDHAHADDSRFLTGSDRRVDLDDLPDLASQRPFQDLETLWRTLRASGYRVLLADLTTPDVEPLGLRVVRAVVPGLHPLFTGFSQRALGGRRLWEVPRKLGYDAIEPETGDNPWPHPYP